MRRALPVAILVWGLCALPLPADPETRQKLIRYFGGWYSYYPGSRISVVETKEIALPGFEAYRVQRHSDSKFHREANIALVERERQEVFVGDVFHDDGRRAARRPFDAAADLPLIEGSLGEAFGLPVRVRAEGERRGPLLPISIEIVQAPGASVARPGFVSEDGAALLLGEFHPLAGSAAEFRRRLLSEREGVHAGGGRFLVSEFLDFQCERCRIRSPAIHRFVAEKGGAVESRFLPLVKTHDWAFGAAEAGAALALLSPALYSKYQEGIFAREGMSAKVARELASDIAEAAGRGEELAALLDSGRPRDRVLADIGLAMRLGIHGTPAFVHEGTLVTGEKDLFETYLAEKLGPGQKRPSAAAVALRPAAESFHDQL